MNEDIRAGETAATRLAAGAALHETLDTADPGAWTGLDAGVRTAGRYLIESLPNRAWVASLSTPATDRATPGGPPATAIVPDPARGTTPARTVEPVESWLALALCHPDGRVREAALTRAAEYPALLPLIVVRSSDWVAPVRERARRLLGRTLGPETAAALAALVLRVGRRERGAFAVGLLRDALRRAPASLFADPDRSVRRFAYRLAVEERLLSPAELARTAVQDSDTVVQELCADAALAAIQAGGDHDDVLGTLLAARGPRVRAAGVTGLRAAGRPEAAATFLADRAAVVRACARYVVRQYDGQPVESYRQWCADPAEPALPPGAVIGLAECGDRTDAGLLWPLLTHPVPGVRARAVAGLRLLDTVDVRRLWPLLDDPAPAVVRETVTAVLPSARELPAGALMERLGPKRPPHVRVAAFRLLDACGGVVGLRAAVALLDDPDVKLRDRAGRAVQGWRPAPDHVPGDAEVGELLDRARHLFSDHGLKQRKWEAGIAG
ncbi:hypothetical protein ACWCPM_21235 [Streptomyces sp. NPDC002309]